MEKDLNNNNHFINNNYNYLQNINKGNYQKNEMVVSEINSINSQIFKMNTNITNNSNSKIIIIRVE